MGSLVISMHGLNACLHRPQSRVCCATCVSRHCIHHTAGCRRRKRSEEVETGSRPERRCFRYTQCFFSAALVSSAQCVHAHAHAQRPEYYRRSSACNSCNRVTKPRKTQKKRILPCHFDPLPVRDRVHELHAWPSGLSGTSRRRAWMPPQDRRLCSGCRASRRKLTPMKTCASSLLACAQCRDLTKGKAFQMPFQNLSRPQPGIRFPSATLQLLKRTASRRLFCLSHPSLEI